MHFMILPPSYLTLIAFLDANNLTGSTNIPLKVGYPAKSETYAVANQIAGFDTSLVLNDQSVQDQAVKGKFSWNMQTNTLSIAEGLGAGTYILTLLQQADEMNGSGGVELYVTITISGDGQTKPPAKDEPGANPSTGDNIPAGLLLALMAISCGVLVRRRRTAK